MIVMASAAEAATETAAVPTGTWPHHIQGVWTHELVDALPDDGMRHELLDGMLLVSPSPVTRHQRAVMRVLGLLDDACPSGHEVFPAPFDWRPDALTSLEPDVLLVPQSALTEANVAGTPALVVEVLSPSTRRIDRTAKMSRYAEGGIGQYWLVDPGAPDREPTVEVFDLVDGEYQRQCRVTGKESVTVHGIVAVTLRPVDLVRPR